MINISVIIPSFNRRELLERALNSVYQQTLSADEVIVIDDGSDDETRAFIQEFFPQVDYIYQENQGVSVARNTGINQAQGQWLAFLDSDDEWLPEKLATQMQALKESQHLVCHTEEIWIRNGVRVNQKNKHQKTGGWIFKQCLPLCAMSPSSIIIQRDVFESVGLFNPDLPACEDYDLWLKIAARFPVTFVSEPQIKKYGGHQDQLSQKYWGMDRFRIVALKAIIETGGLSEENRSAAIQMLLKKAKVYQKGALKRGKDQEVAHYQQLIEQFKEVEN